VRGYSRDVHVIVRPHVNSAERRALQIALERVEVRPSGSERNEQAWWRAGLRETVDADGQWGGYAFSPRSTRGATRA
jgi:hypothetical protein